MGTSLTAVRHKFNHRGALSQQSCICSSFSSSFNISTIYSNPSGDEVECPEEMLDLKFGLFPRGSRRCY